MNIKKFESLIKERGRPSVFIDVQSFTAIVRWPSVIEAEEIRLDKGRNPKAHALACRIAS